jgi:SAM-dependent methyltransferase
MLLRNAGFDEPTILRTLKIKQMSDLSEVKPDELDLSAVPKVLAILIRLFLFTEPVRQREVEEVTDSETLQALKALDILRTGVSEPRAGRADAIYYTPIFLYPLADLVIASDRHNNPDGSPFTPPPDIVFPAISGGTLLFLRLMSTSPAESVLDLGSGTGVAALIMSGSVRRAVASDITSRAAHFARFNRLLNRRFNVEVVQGDLFESVEGQTFDRIVAHPPYVPSLSQETIYRDGGDTGETLVRRIVEGLPKYLRPGGTYYSLSIGIDTTAAKFEERARGWLGSSQDQFDVIFALAEERSCEQFARDRAVLTDTSDPLEVERWNEVFRKAGACGFVFGALVVHRRDGGELTPTGEPGPVTIRVQLTDSTSGSDFDRFFRRH